MVLRRRWPVDVPVRRGSMPAGADQCVGVSPGLDHDGGACRRGVDRLSIIVHCGHLSGSSRWWLRGARVRHRPGPTPVTTVVRPHPPGCGPRGDRSGPSPGRLGRLRGFGPIWGRVSPLHNPWIAHVYEQHALVAAGPTPWRPTVVTALRWTWPRSPPRVGLGPRPARPVLHSAVRAGCGTGPRPWWPTGSPAPSSVHRPPRRGGYRRLWDGQQKLMLAAHLNCR